jgi:uncharacterized protein YlxW (UPF0749 family)
LILADTMTAHAQTLLLAGSFAFFLILILVVSTRLMLAARRRPPKHGTTEQAYQDLVAKIATAQEASAASLADLQTDFAQMKAKLDAVEQILKQKAPQPRDVP